MELEDICKYLAMAGIARTECESFDVISLENLGALGLVDKYAAAVKEALDINLDIEKPLYLHQYEALYALAEGKDVLLISPCGSGKTRVLENAPLVVKLVLCVVP